MKSTKAPTVTERMRDAEQRAQTGRNTADLRSHESLITEVVEALTRLTARADRLEQRVTAERADVLTAFQNVANRLNALEARAANLELYHAGCEEQLREILAKLAGHGPDLDGEEWKSTDHEDN